MKLFKSKLLKNWSQLFSFGMIAQFLGMLATIRIARVLTPTGYGEYNLILTYAGIGAVIGGLGLRNVIIRECARCPASSRQILVKSAILKIAAVICTAIGIFLYISFYSTSLPDQYIYFVILLLVGLIFWDTIESIAFGNEWMGTSATINLSGSVIWILFIWLVPDKDLSILSVTLGFAVLQLVKSIAYLANLQPRITQAVKTRIYSPEELLKQSIPFYWLALLTVVSTQIPILFLAERSGQAEVGLYNAGYRLLLPLQLLINTLLSTIYPILSRTAIKEPDKFKRIILGSFFGISIIGTLGGMIVSLVKTEVVALLFGALYKPSAHAMALQVWYFLMYANFCLIGTILGALDKQRWLAGLSTAYAGVVVPFLWFGSSYGASGLAAAFLIAACVNMVYHWIVFRRSIPGILSNSVQLLIFTIPMVGFALSSLIPETLELVWRLSIGFILIAVFFYFLFKITLIKDIILLRESITE